MKYDSTVKIGPTSYPPNLLVQGFMNMVFNNKVKSVYGCSLTVRNLISVCFHVASSHCLEVIKPNEWIVHCDAHWEIYFAEH